MSIGANIKAARERAGLTQKQLAKACGWEEGQSRIGNYESGTREPAFSDLKLIAGALGGTIHDLLDIEDRHSVAEEPGTHGADKYVYVNKVDGPRLSAGPGEVVWDHEEVEKSHAFRREWMQKLGLNPARCKLMDVEGHSMAPTINHRDTVMFNMGDREVVNGEIYVVVTDDGLRVKRLQRRGGVVWMLSDNQLPQYQPEPITSETAAVVGKVVWRGGGL